MQARKLTAEEVEFEVTIEPCDIRIEGNVLASGDDAADREAEDWTRKEILRGNEYAWCTAMVTARWEDFAASDVLGAISCAGQKEFERDYLPEMRENALDSLNDTIAHAVAKLTV